MDSRFNLCYVLSAIALFATLIQQLAAETFFLIVLDSTNVMLTFFFDPYLNLVMVSNQFWM
jgi:hypothetical protein